MSTTTATFASLVDEDDDDYDDTRTKTTRTRVVVPWIHAADDAMRLLRGRDGAISNEGRWVGRGITRDSDDTIHSRGDMTSEWPYGFPYFVRPMLYLIHESATRNCREQFFRMGVFCGSGAAKINRQSMG